MNRKPWNGVMSPVWCHRLGIAQITPEAAFGIIIRIIRVTDQWTVTFCHVPRRARDKRLHGKPCAVVQYPTGQRGRRDLRPEDDRWRTGGATCRARPWNRIELHDYQWILISHDHDHCHIILTITYINTTFFDTSYHYFESLYIYMYTICNMILSSLILIRSLPHLPKYRNISFIQENPTDPTDSIQVPWVASLRSPMRPEPKEWCDKCRATKRWRPGEDGKMGRLMHRNTPVQIPNTNIQ